MIDKIVLTPAAAVAGIRDGATVMIGGFGKAGMPSELIAALNDQGARELIVVSNNAGNADIDVAALLKTKRARKIICSFPRPGRVQGLCRHRPRGDRRHGAGSARAGNG